MHQTFHELADHSRKWCPWARAWYKERRKRGMKHRAAPRALAFKWTRILFRMWKNRETYLEQRCQPALANAASPLAQRLETH